MRTRKLLALIAALALLAACSPSESAEERFNENSPMYAIQQDGVLRVAVPGIQPFGSANGKGFAPEFGRYIAEDLGVDVEFVEMDSTEMGIGVGGAIVDLAFPLAPITYQALRVDAEDGDYAYASPYLIAHQRLLVPGDAEGDSAAEQLSDLGKNARICSYIDKGTQVDVSKLTEAEVIEVSSPDACVQSLGSRKADAATAVDTHLTTMKIALEKRGDLSWHIVGDQLNTEGYAAMALPGAMATYIIGELNDIEEEGLWLEYYNEWLEPHLGPVEGPPDLTLQDAASLFPPEPTPTPSD